MKKDRLTTDRKKVSRGKDNAANSASSAAKSDLLPEPIHSAQGYTGGYKGKVTTSGTSEALRFDKSLFRQHPEFEQKAELIANVIGPGTMLVSLSTTGEVESGEDPIVCAFLSFLERDMLENPHAIQPLSAEQIARAKDLTANVTVTDDELD
ncbi:MAG: type II toxin-antitoxin system PrlF family antitoxin [Candidatus Obscuribacterales bacterium]|nr:type II toxin-antitoxin system PrlF family antitoxin [Candidatus Obscuribacterales bacterium]